MNKSDLVPDVNDRAWLSLNGDINTLYPSRIEGIENGEITIAAPLTFKGNSMVEAVTVPNRETKCALLWNENENKYWKQDCSLEQVDVNGSPTWKLKMVGDPYEVQRRSFVRVPEDMQAQLHLSDRTTDAQVND